MEAVDQAAMAIRQQILIALLLVSGFCFYSLGEAKVEKKTVATARKEDVPFIKCSVCEAIAKQLVRQVKEKREKSAPKKVFTYFTCNLFPLITHSARVLSVLNISPQLHIVRRLRL